MALYSFKHLLIIFISIIIPILWAFNIKKNNMVLKIGLYLLCVLELIRIVFLLVTDDFQINKDLSLQLCFTYLIVGFIYLKSNKNYLLSYLGAFGLLFGLSAILLRDPNPLLCFDTVQCYIYHSIMVFLGVYIIKNYKMVFNFKCIMIIWIQILLGLIANIIIKDGANYIFLNSFVFPDYHLSYSVNVEMFNLPIFFGYSINNLLIYLISSIGYFYYIILLIIIINLFSSLWLFIINKFN